MSSMNSFTPQFDSVDSIVNYLLEPSPPEVVSSSTTSSTIGSTTINNGLKSTKKQKKEKVLANIMNATEANSKENAQILSSGRIKYGPITVNPRKRPSKTLFTGRRSKYELLSGDEEEKRRVRRERNRVAATKCREKRDSVLVNLENEFDKELNHCTHLTNSIKHLEQRKQYLQSILANHLAVCSMQQINQTPPPQQPSVVFADTGHHSSVIETPSTLILPHQLGINSHDEEQFSHFLQPTPVLTNSAYNLHQSNQVFLPEQQSQQSTMTMNTSSLDRLINSLHSPTSYIDNNNNNCSGLFNSTYGSSCIQQHSNPIEDDSSAPTHNNSYVY